jgi:hypothetical protein
MVEEDLYIPGQMMDSVDNDSTSSSTSSSDLSEGLSRPCPSSFPRPSASLPDISASYANLQTIRRSISERHKRQSLTSQLTTNTVPQLPAIQPAPPTPNYSRVFPRPRTPSTTARPAASQFNLYNLLSKRSARDGGSETGERPRKTKKVSILPVSLTVGLSSPGVSEFC